MSISGSDTPRASGKLAMEEADPLQKGKSQPKESSVKRKHRSKVPPVESVSQLLRVMYVGTFKRSILKKAELSAMQVAPGVDKLELEELLALASSDRTLDRTRRLMLLGDGLGSHPVASQIRDFSGQVLRRHPAFSIDSVAGVLRNFPDVSRDEKAIRALSSHDYLSLSWPNHSDPLKKSEMSQCKANAVCCLLLWIRATRGISVESIHRHLQENLWKHHANRYETETKKIRVLMSARSTVSLSISYILAEQQALDQKRRADAARRAEERAVNWALKLKEELATGQAGLAKAQGEIDRLKKELNQKVQAHRNEQVHLKDDYEKLRGRVLRRLKDELSLLDDGLHALRRKPPKVHVMVDHAERAIDGLKREMERLRRNY